MVGRTHNPQGERDANPSRPSSVDTDRAANDLPQFQILSATAAAKHKTLTLLSAGWPTRRRFSVLLLLDSILKGRQKLYHYLNPSTRKEGDYA